MNKAMNHKRKIMMVVFAMIALFMARWVPGSSYRFPKIGPNMRGAINYLLFANESVYPLHGSWKIDDYVFSDTDIKVTLKDSASRKAVYRLAYPLLPFEGVKAGATRSFRIEMLENDMHDANEIKMLSVEFRGRVSNNDIEFFYSKGGMEEPESEVEYLFKCYVYSPVLCMGLLCAAAFFIVNFKVMKDDILPKNAQSWVLLIVVMIVGVVLRAKFGPGVPVHANNHGIQEIRTLLFPGPGNAVFSIYGEVYNSVMRWCLVGVGRAEAGIYRVNELFGALAIAAVFMIARAVGLSQRNAFIASLAQCLAPSQIWVSGTESCMAMFTFYSAAGLSLLLLSIRKYDVWLLWHGAIMLAFAATMHLITLFILPIVLVMGIAGMAGRPNDAEGRREYRTHVLICCGVAAVWVYFHCLAISPGRYEQAPAYFTPLKYLSLFFSEKNVLLDPSLTPLIVTVAAFTGISLMIFRRTKYSLAAFILWPLTLVASMSVVGCRENVIRYQAPYQWFYFLPAAYATTAALKTNLRPVLKNALRIIFVAVLIASSCFGMRYLAAGDVETNEYEFMREGAMKLPAGASIVLPVNDGAHGKMNTDFPDYLKGDKVIKGAHGYSGNGEVIYVGLDCYRYGDDPERKREILGNGMRRECAQICGGGILKALFERTLVVETNPFGFQKQFWNISNPNPRVGFYRCESQPTMP